MRYTVIWTPSAEQHLAAIWLAAADRKAVTSAAGALDRLLADDPDQKGIINFDTVRTVIVEPLGIDCEVIEADRIVFVLAVWDTTPGGSG